MYSLESKIPFKDQNLSLVLNLVKRKWKGSKTCCFCGTDETIQHLFFECPMARLMWDMVNISFRFQPPTSVTNLFDSWLRSFCYKLRNQIFIGIAAMCWALWFSRNDVVFRNSKPNSCL